MSRIAIALLFVVSCSSAFAVPADNAASKSPSVNAPGTKLRLHRGPGDFPRSKPYARSDMLAAAMEEEELVCLSTGSCKPRLASW
jgi:hypothetical protein